MQLGHVSGSDGTTTLSDARAMTVTLGDVTLWVGPGGSLNDNGTATDVTDATTLSDDTVQAGDLGFSGHVNSMKLATLKDLKGNTNPADDVSYLALELTGLSATLVGVDGLTFGIWDAAVKVNKVKDGDTNSANDPAKLDWANFTVDDGLALDGFTVDAGVDVDVQGSVALDAFGVLIAKGSFKVQFGTVTELGADHLPGGTGNNADTKYEEMVVTLGSTAFATATDVEVFIGVGGFLQDANSDDNTDGGSFSDDTVNKDDGIGFYTSLESLTVVTLKNAGNPGTADDKSYLAVDASGIAAELVGIPGDVVTMKIWDASLKINQAKDTDSNATNDPTKLDWTTFFNNAEGLKPDVIPNVDASVDITVVGSIFIDFDGFVQAYGSFAFSKSSGLAVKSVTAAGVSTDRTVNVVTFGLEGVNVFFGAGPYFQDTNNDGHVDGLDTVNTDAVGLLLKNVSMAVAVFKPTAGLGNYYAVMVRAADVQLLGLDIGGSDAFSLTASGYRLELNGGSNGTADAAIDFSKMPGGKYTVETGPGHDFDFDYTSKLQRVAIENAVLKIEDYVYVSGGLSFTRQQGMTVTLSGNGARDPSCRCLRVRRRQRQSLRRQQPERRLFLRYQRRRESHRCGRHRRRRDRPGAGERQLRPGHHAPDGRRFGIQVGEVHRPEGDREFRRAGRHRPVRTFSRGHHRRIQRGQEFEQREGRRLQQDGWRLL